jgi:hypothetical protein
MTRVVINDALRGLLPNLSEPLLFCDDQGQVIGQFIPVPPTVIGQKEPPPLSEEELQRRLTEEPTYTTAEVIAYLESLP